MTRSLLQKVLYGILWIWVISLIAFFLSKQLPGDEILDYLSIDDQEFSVSLNPAKQRDIYARVAQNRGLDLPGFYFSIHKGYYPEALFTIQPKEDQHTVRAWIEQSHQPDASLVLHHQLRSSLRLACNATGLRSGQQEYCNQIHQLLTERDVHKLPGLLSSMDAGIHQVDAMDTLLRAAIENAMTTVKALQLKTILPLSDYLPVMSWNGTKNQYHQWITGLITFKPVTSLMDGRNAWTKIGEALKWTLIINVFAFILSITLGCLIGIWSSMNDGKIVEKITSILLFGAFAIPSFWLATLLIMFFSSGEWLSVFPSGGLGPHHAANTVFEKWGILFRHLVLPVFCLTIGSLAYVSRQMKQSVSHELKQNYVLSLRTLGVSEKTIRRKHVVRNALFPIITMLGHSLPALLSGSLIIEVIFSIPGMGRLLFTSLLARDWPVAFPILMLGAVVTVFAYIGTDLVYKWADPRVKSIS